MILAFDEAVTRSGKRFKASSYQVYKSTWKRLCLNLSPDGLVQRPVSSEALRQALAKYSNVSTAKKALGLFKWVAITLADTDQTIGDAHIELLKEYDLDERPQHEIDEPRLKMVKAADVAKDTAVRGWKATRLETIVLLLSETGLRSEEVIKLKTSDFLVTGDKTALVIHKGARTRKVLLSPSVVLALEEWLKARPICSSDVLFVADDSGKSMTPSTLWRQLKKIDESIGAVDGRLSGVMAYRVAGAARLRQEGKSIEEIQQWLGHRLTSSTEELLSRV
ncbi:site-specific integrase [Nostoc sp. CHAB 5834]|nr:site-specific integrase [Nostoc sp. CHAB 5834]